MISAYLGSGDLGSGDLGSGDLGSGDLEGRKVLHRHRCVQPTSDEGFETSPRIVAGREAGREGTGGTPHLVLVGVGGHKVHLVELVTLS